MSGSQQEPCRGTANQQPPPSFTLGEQRLTPHSRSESRGVQWGTMQRAQTWSWVGCKELMLQNKSISRRKQHAALRLSAFCLLSVLGKELPPIQCGSQCCSQLHRMSALQVCGLSLLNRPEQLSLLFPGGVGLWLWMGVWHCCSCSQVGKLRHGGYGGEAAFSGGGWCSAGCELLLCYLMLPLAQSNPYLAAFGH